MLSPHDESLSLNERSAANTLASVRFGIPSKQTDMPLDTSAMSLDTSNFTPENEQGQVNITAGHSDYDFDMFLDDMAFSSADWIGMMEQPYQARIGFPPLQDVFEPWLLADINPAPRPRTDRISPSPVASPTAIYSAAHSPVADNAMEWPDYHVPAIPSPHDFRINNIHPSTLRDLLVAPHFDGIPQSKYDEISNALDWLQKKPTYVPFGPEMKFPSREVLDIFCQVYFETFHKHYPFLHCATFANSKNNCVLIVAVAAIGARFTRMQESQLIADSLTEVLRRLFSYYLEKNNTCVRQIENMQAYVLFLISSLYSGNARLMEIANGLHSQVIVRSRRKMLYTSQLELENVLTGSTSLSLDSQWKLWRIDEARRRLGFMIWLFDNERALLFDLRPMLSLSEMQNTLPCSERLWAAPTALAWKSKFTGPRWTVERQSLQTILPKVYAQRKIPELSSFNSVLVVQALFRSAWDLGTSNHLPIALLEVKSKAYTEFVSILVEIFSIVPLSSSAALFACLGVVALHSNLSDLMQRAGWQTTSRHALSATTSIREWIENDARRARIAVLFAAKVYRIARMTPLNRMEEPNALLHAALVLIAYGRFGQYDPDAAPFNIDGQLSHGQSIDWVEYGDRMNPFIMEIGALCGSNTPRVSQKFEELIGEMDIWTISKGYARVLSKLDT